MMGKPSFPDDVDTRDDAEGSALGTSGLTALDEEREASLADEGGASGAVAEQRAEPAATHERRDGALTAIVAGASFAAAALGVLAYRRWAR